MNGSTIPHALPCRQCLHHAEGAAKLETAGSRGSQSASSIPYSVRGKGGGLCWHQPRHCAPWKRGRRLFFICSLCSLSLIDPKMTRATASNLLLRSLCGCLPLIISWGGDLYRQEPDQRADEGSRNSQRILGYISKYFKNPMMGSWLPFKITVFPNEEDIPYSK